MMGGIIARLFWLGVIGGWFVAAMCLVEAGKLSLETSIRHYVPEAPESWADITLAHLLSHTSGINDFYRNQASGFADLPQAYPDFVEEAVFASLGLSCRWGGTEVEILNRNPVLYERIDGQLVNHTVNFSPFSYPAGGLNATALDIARFLSALQAGQLLSYQSLKRLWQPVRLNDGSTFSYGFGFSVSDYKGHSLISHEGGGQSWNLHLPDVGLSIAVICNLSGARADEVVTDLADMVLGECEKI
jgi:CubicO group peptidase (beta-lactamase class C family)